MKSTERRTGGMAGEMTKGRADGRGMGEGNNC